jgi:hypothetical protein
MTSNPLCLRIFVMIHIIILAVDDIAFTYLGVGGKIAKEVLSPWD